MKTEHLFPSLAVFGEGHTGNCPSSENRYGGRETGEGGLLIVRVSLTKTQQVTKRNSAGRETPVRAALYKLADSLAGDGSGLGRWVTTLPVGRRG